MGLFDIFKEKPTTLGTFHGIDLREWDTGYKQDTKALVKFLNSKLNSMSYEKFIIFLKKRDDHRKFIDEELIDQDLMNKIKITEPKGKVIQGISLIPKTDYFAYPKNLLNHKDTDCFKSFRIVDSKFMYDRKAKVIEGDFKTLVMFNICNDEDYWKKKISSEKSIRSMSFQYIDLDNEEYQLVKIFENKIKNMKDSKLFDNHFKLLDTIFKVLLNTKKRKKYPINRFQSYLAFEE
tara:strand:+ start:133 stop:837 length:705 start_codon:yes stop_codon:yes gene_type:complete